MSMIKAKPNAAAEQKPAADTPDPAPAAGAVDTPDPAAAKPAADESKRFASQSTERPDYIPEKFWKDGKPDLEGLAKSYAEIETWKGTKTEELLKQLDADRLKARPEAPDKYEVKPIEGVEPTVLEASPLVKFWRETAHKAGFSNDQFNEGIGHYMKLLQETMPSVDDEKKQLGENADVRIDAVEKWAQATFTDPKEFEAVQQVATTAAGIKALERLMSKAPQPAADVQREPELTIDELRKMQNDPRYYDQARRDAAWVKKVDEGFARLYAKK
jgi:hypothetical protein